MKKKCFQVIIILIYIFLSISSTKIPETYSRYSTDFHKKITLNIRQPEYDVEFVPNKYNLPNEYTELEYIKSTGTQYIITDIVPTNTTGVSITFEYLNNDKEEIYFGTGNSENTNGFWIGSINSKIYYRWDKLYSSGSSISLIQLTENEKYTAKMNYLNNRSLVFDDASYYSSLPALSAKTLPIAIFGAYKDTTNEVDRLAKIKLYNFVITEGSTIIANFVPCYKNSDGTVGLYDIINNVFYDNDGTGEFIKGIKTQHFIYDTSDNLETNEFERDNYVFKNWNTQKDGSGTSYEDEEEVINLTQNDGEIVKLYATYSISNRLYDVLKSEAVSGSLAKKYIGTHQDAYDASRSTNNIYYWNGDRNTILEKANVIFAGTCWYMYRTTDTGGVRLMYNGEAENNTCPSSRNNHVGFSRPSSKSLNSNYYYADSFTYDSSTKKFSLTGEKVLDKWSASTYSSLIDKYTCASNNPDGTCQTLYYVSDYSSNTNGIVVSLSGNTNYATLGSIVYSSGYSSLANVGYMYNKTYSSNTKVITKVEAVTTEASLSTSIYYADEYIYPSSTGGTSYKLSSPSRISSSQISTAVGKYTLGKTSSTSTGTPLQYVVGVDTSTNKYYYLKLTGGQELDSITVNYTYGDSYTDNGNGTYTINNPSTITNFDYYTNHEQLNGKYVCKNANNNSCSEVWYVVETLPNAIHYNLLGVSGKYVFASNFTYNDGKYTLTDDNKFTLDINEPYDFNKLNSARYTCFNTSGECTELAYIYNLKGNTVYYISLTNGQSSSDITDDLLYGDNVNVKNSEAKGAVDAWYRSFILPFDDYVDDTIYCNDRTMSNSGGWINGEGSIIDTVKFTGTSTNLYCTNVTDQLSVSNPVAKLKYKAAIPSYAEISNTNAHYFFTDIIWSMTPAQYNGYSYMYGPKGGTSLTSQSYQNNYASTKLKPILSLKANVGYSSGDGSSMNPYIATLN